MIAICTVTYNRLMYAKLSVKYLLEEPEDFKLTIIDNNSTEPGMKEWLNDIIKDPRINVMFNSENKGLAYAINQFFDILTDEEYIGFVYSDSVVPKNYMRSFKDCLDKNKEIGILCACEWGVCLNKQMEVVEDYTLRKILDTPISFDVYKKEIIDKYAEKGDESGIEEKDSFAVLYASMITDLCSILRRDVFNKIGKYPKVGSTIFGIDWWIGLMKDAGYKPAFYCWELGKVERKFVIHLGAPESIRSVIDLKDNPFKYPTVYLKHAREVWKERHWHECLQGKKIPF